MTQMRCGTIDKLGKPYLPKARRLDPDIQHCRTDRSRLPHGRADACQISKQPATNLDAIKALLQKVILLHYVGEH